MLTRQQTAAECPELSRHLLGIPNHAALVRQVGNCTAARPALKPDGSPRGSQGFLALNLLPLLADLHLPLRVQPQIAEQLQPQLTADGFARQRACLPVLIDVSHLLTADGFARQRACLPVLIDVSHLLTANG